MENQAVRRRMNIIASHLGCPEDFSATATHLVPLSCSNSLSSVIRRCDSRLYFARQSASSQACFMRQVPNDQGNFAQSKISAKSNDCAKEGPCTYEAPMFSRPSTMEPSVHNVGELQWLQQACDYHQPVPDPPNFARPSRRGHHCYSGEKSRAPILNEWLPKMDVEESGGNYLITIELPGVRASNIRVEVNNQNLRVTGYRSIDWRKVTNYSIDSRSAYQRKEISQGPYNIVWPLPTSVKKDSISAEFVEGLLLITIPKIF